MAMKISVVIPSYNEAEYVEELTAYIKANSKPENIEEIIIVESFNTKKIVKVAEKSHAKLYYNLHNSSIDKMNVGAFQANGEIIYFIKPGCVPPVGFDERIIKFVKNKYNMGYFGHEASPSDHVFLRLYKKYCALFLRSRFQFNSFFILNTTYHQTVGFKNYFSTFRNKLYM